MASVFEAMNQLTGRPFVLEGGDQADAPLEDPVRRRSKGETTSIAEKTGRAPMTRLAEHVEDAMPAE